MKMSKEKVVLASACYVVLNILTKKKRNRKTWVRKLLMERRECGGPKIMRDLSTDEEGFKHFTRLSYSDFENILSLVGGKICKKDTNFRKAITPTERLLVTLRYLATGDSFISLMYLFRISKQTISFIVADVCKAIIEALPDYLFSLSCFCNLCHLHPTIKVDHVVIQ